MKKIGIIIVISIFLYSQVLLAGASVLCVTQDGQTHLETTDNHGHCMGKSDADCASHIYDDVVSAVLCIAESHCHDIPLAHTKAVISAKRLSKITFCYVLPDVGIKLHSTNCLLKVFSQYPASLDRLTTLRAVVLLI